MKKGVIILLLAFLAACVPVQNGNRYDEDTVDLTWPHSQQQARIRFVNEVSGPGDLGIRPSAFRRMMNALAGQEDLGMVRPYAVAVRNQRMLIGDPGLHAVHLFDLEKRFYQLISTAGKNSLSAPVGVALGTERMFVADSALGRIFVLDEKGDLLQVIDELDRPTGLAFDAASNRLFAADTLGHRLVVFDREGRKLFEFGTRGTGKGEFNFPSHIFLSTNRLLVNDSMNFRVQVFDLEGRFISSFGTHGDGSGHFSQPKGVAADSYGHVYVAGATIDRVQIFSQSGQFLMAFGSKGKGTGQFLMPAGMAIDNNRIYVADSLNSRIQIFDYVGGQ